MARYIDADSVVAFPIRRNHCDKQNANPAFINGIETVMEYIDSFPTVDAVPVVHGEWVRQHHRKEIPDMGMMITGEYPTCSICEFAEMGLAQETNYCPKCGAKMDGGKPNEPKRSN